MPLLIDTRAPNNIQVGYHRITKAEIDFDRNTAVLLVPSHVDQSSAINGMTTAWEWRLNVSVSEFISEDPLMEVLERLLINDPGSPFSGGQIVPDQSNTLKAAKERAWTRVKLERSRAEGGNFTYDGGTYQADKVRITGAVQLALLAKSAGVPYSETWTLTDNTTRVLDADGVIAMGLALGTFVSGIYATGRALREQINAATTIEEADAIRWPA